MKIFKQIKKIKKDILELDRMSSSNRYTLMEHSSLLENVNKNLLYVKNNLDYLKNQINSLITSVIVLTIAILLLTFSIILK